MDVKELMIGDIVMATAYCEYEDGDDGYTKFPVRIDGIFNYNNIDINEWNIAASSIQEGLDYESYDDFEPIPLTAEILELNGFRKIGDGYVTIYNGLNICYCPNGHQSDDFKWYLSIGYHMPWIKPIYVHELQHALRLCGLGELADNFKVE